MTTHRSYRLGRHSTRDLTLINRFLRQACEIQELHTGTLQQLILASPKTPGNTLTAATADPKIRFGDILEFGATHPGGVTNFAVYAPRATGAWVCLFGDDDTEERIELAREMSSDQIAEAQKMASEWKPKLER